MPSRVLRADILSSESLSQVSMEAEMVFVRLILLADDYGRLDGRIPVLRASMFPLRPEVTVKKFEKWLAELLLISDPPLIQYVVEGRPYLELTGWEKHRGRSRRAKSSKYPAPPTDKREAVPGGEEIRASPEILENPSNPPEGKESGVVGKESGEIPADPRGSRSRVLPGEWDLSNPKPRLKPQRFEGQAREDILEWAKRRNYHERIMADLIRVWDRWGPTKDFQRPISSWVGSFKNLASKAIDEGTVQLETEDERYRRELESSPFRVVNGGAGDA